MMRHPEGRGIRPREILRANDSGLCNTGAMTIRGGSIVVPLVLAAALAAGLSACSTASQHPVVEPVTRSAGSLQGATVKLPLDAILNISTGSLSPTSYSADIAQPTIAQFTKGTKSGTLETNPGIRPLKVGETKVTLKNANGGIQWVTFTVDVVKN
jgi:hypothetical protein